MTYLVMECHPAFAIVIDNEGRIIKTANMGYEEGQIIENIIAQQIPKAGIVFRLAPLAAAACLCLAVLGGGAYGAYRVPYGAVEVKINPNVKMSVSYMDRVVGIEGVNEDGESLIENIVFRGQTSEYVTSVLVDRAIDMGYLSEGGDIYVAASGGNARWKEKREDSIRNGLDQLLKGRMPVEIHVGEGIKESSPAVQSHQDTGGVGGTGAEKPVFINMPSKYSGEDRQDTEDDDREMDDEDDQYMSEDGPGKRKTEDEDDNGSRQGPENDNGQGKDEHDKRDGEGDHDIDIDDEDGKQDHDDEGGKDDDDEDREDDDDDNEDRDDGAYEDKANDSGDNSGRRKGHDNDDKYEEADDEDD